MSVLLASDLAQEVRGEFDGQRKAGQDIPSATAHVLARFGPALHSAADGPVVLIALAALQLREGHLQAVIRDAAIDLIDSEEAINAYRPLDLAQRKSLRQVLEQFGRLLQDTATQTGK